MSDDGPSIAPPSLGFGFRRTKRGDAGRAPEGAPQDDVAVPEPTEAAEPTEAEPADVGALRPGPTTIFDVGPATVPSVDPEPALEPASAVEPEPEPEPASVVEPEPEPVVEPAAGTPDDTALIPGLDDTTQAQPVVQPVPVPTTPAPAVAAAPVRPARTTRPAATATSPRGPRPTTTVEPIEPARAPRPPRQLDAPAWLVGPVAAAVIGAVVGLVMVALTAVALQGCELFRGTASCGGGPGFLLLLAVVAVGVLLGATLLRATGSDGPVSTSILAVGVLAVLVMVFLLGSIYAWWMVVAIPLLGAATYAGAAWASTAFAEPDS